MSVKAKCKNCGQEAPAEQFRLHFQLKQMVCPTCYTGKKATVQKAVGKKEELFRPAGWDKEDEYLERAVKMKQEYQQTQFSTIPGSDQVKCTCFNCKYVFRYNPSKRQPGVCPYCNEEVPRMKTSSF